MLTSLSISCGSCWRRMVDDFSRGWGWGGLNEVDCMDCLASFQDALRVDMSPTVMSHHWRRPQEQFTMSFSLRQVSGFSLKLRLTLECKGTFWLAASGSGILSPSMDAYVFFSFFDDCGSRIHLVFMPCAWPGWLQATPIACPFEFLSRLWIYLQPRTLLFARPRTRTVASPRLVSTSWRRFVWRLTGTRAALLCHV